MTVENLPGQPALRRRVRTHPTALAALRAELARPTNPPEVRGLAAQAPAEPGVALLDAFAVVADVVGFYTERWANEGYLRTATERRSVRELARTLGYEVRPGVAASTQLVFTVEDAPGAPASALVPAGTPVQSVPGPGQLPQTFETGATLTAHRAWNALPARASEAQLIRPDDPEVWLEGRHPGLRRGEALLIVDAERVIDHGHPVDRERCALRRVLSATVDPPGHAGWTLLVIDRGARTPELPRVLRRTQTVWHLTERGQLFGATAPDPGFLRIDDKPPPGSESDGEGGVRWKGFQVAREKGVVELDGDRLAVLPDSWIVLEGPGAVEAYRVQTVEADGAGRWAIAGKLTRLTLGRAEGLDRFDRRSALVHSVSVRLPAGRRPLDTVPPGRTLTLEPFEPLLVPGQPVVLQGPDAAGAVHAEVAAVVSCVPSGDAVTLTLDADLTHAYAAAGLAVRGNVVAATHGETVTQVLGSGDGRTPFRAFVLRRDPLTHVRAATPAGAAAALEVRVDGVAWRQVEGFADCGPSDRVYRLVRAEGPLDGQGAQPTSVVFGDGTHGAVPPTGQENIVATYRAGIGEAGALASGQLQLLVRRPHGVREVTNPQATRDWAPPETLEEARRNAPLRVRTLDRVVSLADFADVARAYAGVGPARADEVWDGRRTTVVVSVRGVRGTDPSRGLLDDLTAAIEAIRDPRLPFVVRAGTPMSFGVRVSIAIEPTFVTDEVRSAVAAALTRDLGAGVLDFGRTVTAASVLLSVRGTPGVRTCTLPTLVDAAGAASDLLVAPGARWEGALQPAVVLALDPAAVEIGVLP